MKEDGAMKMGHSPKKKVSYAEAKKNNPNLDKLIKTRSGAEKGSAEYVKAQNAINKAYGVSKRHSVTGGAAKKPGVEELVSSKTKTSSTKGKTTSIKDKKVDMKGAEVTTTKIKPNKTKSVTVTQDADGKLSGTKTKVKKSGKTKTKKISTRRAARIARKEGLID